MGSSSNNLEKTGSYNAFATVVVINVVIMFAILIAFYVLRKIKNTKYFMAPQYYDMLNTNNPLPEPKGLFGWLPTLFRFSENDILRLRGVDSVIYLRFQKFMAFMFIAFIPLAIGVLLPVNFTSTNDSISEAITGIPKLSVGNVSETSGRLYAHAIITLIFTIIVFFFCNDFYKKFKSLRTVWMKQDEPHNYTVMYQSSSAITQSPEKFFQGKYPGEVVDVQFATDAGSFRKVAKKWGKMAKKLRFAEAQFEETGIRPTHRVKKIFGEKVDSIDYYTAHVEEITRTLDRKRTDFVAADRKTHIGFVTFQSIAQAYRHASEKSVFGPGHHFRAKTCPQVFDVEWKDMNKTPRWRKYMTPALWASVTCLILFWSAITVFAQGLVNLESLSQTSAFSWLQPVLDWNPILTGFVTGFLPSLIVTILTAILPKILQGVVRLRGVDSRGQLTRNVTVIYFGFLIVNVFLVSIFAGGAFFVLYDLVKSGSSPLPLLGNGIPSQAIFFLNFTIVYTLIKVPLQIMRIGPFFTSMFKKWRAKSQLASHEAQKQKPLNFQILYGVDLLFFVIGFTYASIQPFLLPWIVLYFFFEYISSKYLIIYAQQPEYDSGGLIWPSLFNRILAGTILSQLVILGVLILKKSPALAIIAPLPIITIIFAVYMHKKYDQSCLFLEEHEREDVSAPGGGQKFANYYKDPILHHNFHYDKETNWELPTTEQNRRRDIEQGSGSS